MRIRVPARFLPFFNFELRGKGGESSRAELKILLIKLWLEPARLGLITTKHSQWSCPNTKVE